MNWLAHLYLSEADPAVRIGNLLPDFVAAASLTSLPAGFQKGIRLHRRIDAFTDSHPIVRQSVRRFIPPMRRFGGILTDIFYDHFLAHGWENYSLEPLAQFVEGVYASFTELEQQIPEEARLRFAQMRGADWLNSYRDLSGVAAVIGRVSTRFSRPVDLREGLSILEQNYDAFRADFRHFFPELRSHVAESDADGAK